MVIEHVTIKSYPNGLSLYLDEDVSFNIILEEVAIKFQKSSDFFKDATLVLSIDGRELSIEEERLILQTIEQNSKLCICSIAGKDKSKELLFENRLKNLKEISTLKKVEVQENKIVQGSLHNLQSVESDATIIVLGDIEKGASVTSEKDVIILGTLYGEARAGVDKKTNHFIFAMGMEPEGLFIGEKTIEFNKKILKRTKKVATISYIENEELVINQMDKKLFEENLC